LVGTQRRTLPAYGSTVDDPVDPAEALLDAAATLTLYRRAGVAPATGLALPEPAPDDSAIPAVPAAAATRLADRLASDPASRAGARPGRSDDADSGRARGVGVRRDRAAGQRADRDPAPRSGHGAGDDRGRLGRRDAG